MPEEERIAIVTGGGRGIGRAAARALASTGVPVAVIARTGQEVQDTAEQILGAGGSATAVIGDVRDTGAVTDLTATAEEQLGAPCGILINAAGITGPVDELVDVDPADWQAVLDINVTGALAMCRAVIPGMRQHHSGRIVNVTSGLARRAQPGLGAYSASKAALLHFSRVMDAENRAHGVRVFAIEPGVVRTEMNAFLRSQEPTGVRRSVVEMLERMEADPGFVEAEESAELIRLAATGRADDLAGEAASIYDPAVRARLARTASRN